MLEDGYSSVNLQFDVNDIDHAHRIGLPYTDKNLGKKLKSIIVKFRSWKACQCFYKVNQGIMLIARRNQVSLFQLI